MVFRGLLMKTELKEKDDLEDSGVIGEPSNTCLLGHRVGWEV